MDKFKTLLIDLKNSVATVTLNRPDRLNALSIELREELACALDALQKEDDVRAVVLTGAGRGFCSGADVGQQQARIAGEIGKASRKEILERIGGSLLPAIQRFEKPLIGAINGVAAGAGLSLVLACDIRIASSAARFAAIWVKRGLVPDVGATFYMPRQLGMSAAFEMAYTGDMVAADRAMAIGLVSRVVPPEDLMKTALELAGRIAKGPPITLEIIKRAFHRGIVYDLSAALDFETYGQNLCRTTEDHREGVKSFQEKREPAFKGL